ncbi:MAG: hypothetical protein NTW86_13765, partial [Candidatus Sumerlaeota bacterium]|nr:hypothetical protein [Candidatus Sumerlaeota bacterium]
MKKSLILALGTIMLAMASQVSFANAPVFKDIPDVIIGDADFNNGLTVDLNFFTYINALNLLPGATLDNHYIADNDTAASALRLAFKEWPVDQASDLEINGKLQLLSGSGELSDDKDTWGAKELTGGTQWWLSFRDLVRSPHRGGTPDPTNTPPNGSDPYPDPLDENGNPVLSGTVEVLPWHNVDGSPGVLSLGAMGPGFQARTVSLYVADEDNVVTYTKGLLVYSKNNANDSLSGGFTTLFHNAFDTTSENQWAFQSYAGIGVATSSGGMTGGFLGMEAGQLAGTANTSMYFGRWQTVNNPLDTYGFTQLIEATTADQIYQARYRMRLTTDSGGGPASKDNAPQIRLGVQNGGLNSSLEMWITSTPTAAGGDVNTQLPTVGQTKDYNIFWSPMENTPNWDNMNIPSMGIDARTWAAFFDVLDADEGSAPYDAGKGLLEDFLVGHVNRPGDLDVGSPASLRYVLTDLTSSGGFAVGQHDASTFVQLLPNNPSAGKIKFQDAGLNTNASPSA